MDIFPFRLRYAKTGRLRFLSHHDMIRMWERAIRRADLPIRFSQGFNPHPSMSFPTATAVGIESLDEVLEIELATWLAPRAIQEAMAAQAVEGLKILSVEPFSRSDRSHVEWVEYRVDVPVPPDFAARVDALMARESVVIDRPRDWGVQTIDIRPFVAAVEAREGAVVLRIRVTDRGSARTEEVLGELGLPKDASVRVVKTRTELARRAPSAHPVAARRGGRSRTR